MSQKIPEFHCQTQTPNQQLLFRRLAPETFFHVTHVLAEPKKNSASINYQNRKDKPLLTRFLNKIQQYRPPIQLFLPEKYELPTQTMLLIFREKPSTKKPATFQHQV